MKEQSKLLRQNRKNNKSGALCKSGVRVFFVAVTTTLLIFVTVGVMVLFTGSTYFDANEFAREGKKRFNSVWVDRMQRGSEKTKIGVSDANLNSSSNLLQESYRIRKPSTSNIRSKSVSPTAVFEVETETNLNVPPALIEARKILKKHIFNHLPSNKTVNSYKLEEIMYLLQSQKQCTNKPIFTSMAQVGTDLYWQLIENFIYTMVKFDLIECTIMICVTDQNCMNLCKLSGFPCYYYDFTEDHPGVEIPSALEQIANLKLFYLPKALEKGVSRSLF